MAQKVSNEYSEEEQNYSMTIIKIKVYFHTYYLTTILLLISFSTVNVLIQNLSFLYEGFNM